MRSQDLERCDFLLSSGVLWTGLAGTPPALAQQTRLRDLAQAKGRVFDSEVLHHELVGDPFHSALVTEQCGAITLEWEAKWDWVEPRPGVFDFEPLDWLVDFARRNGQPAVRRVVTWGLPDRYGYQNDFPEYQRKDGLKARGLPYDDWLQPKAIWQAVAQAFAHAPS